MALSAHNEISPAILYECDRLLGPRSSTGQGGFLAHRLLESSARFLLSTDPRRSTTDLGRQTSTGSPLQVHHSHLPVKPGIPLERPWCTDQSGKLFLERNFDRTIRYRHS